MEAWTGSDSSNPAEDGLAGWADSGNGNGNGNGNKSSRAKKKSLIEGIRR